MNSSKLLYDVQIMHNPIWITVSQKNFAIAGLDAYTTIAPDIGAAFTQTANSVTACDTPVRGGVLLNLTDRNRPQAITQRANFHSAAGKDVLEAAPGHCSSRQQN